MSDEFEKYQGAVKLAVAMIMQAVEEWLALPAKIKREKSPRERRKLMRALRDAERYLFKTKNPEWFLSFESICETLNLDPGMIRKKLREKRRAGGGRRPNLQEEEP